MSVVCALEYNYYANILSISIKANANVVRPFRTKKWGNDWMKKRHKPLEIIPDALRRTLTGYMHM